jgi:hypothetical protein
MDETAQPLPPPDMGPQAITVAQYRSHAPEKFELWEGYLFTGPDYPEERHRLLSLLLVNVGLLEAVKLAPEERWREALEQVYG